MSSPPFTGHVEDSKMVHPRPSYIVSAANLLPYSSPIDLPLDSITMSGGSATSRIPAPIDQDQRKFSGRRAGIYGFQAFPALDPIKNEKTGLLARNPNLLTTGPKETPDQARARIRATSGPAGQPKATRTSLLRAQMNSNLGSKRVPVKGRATTYSPPSKNYFEPTYPLSDTIFDCEDSDPFVDRTYIPKRFLINENASNRSEIVGKENIRLGTIKTPMIRQQLKGLYTVEANGELSQENPAIFNIDDNKRYISRPGNATNRSSIVGKENIKPGKINNPKTRKQTQGLYTVVANGEASQGSPTIVNVEDTRYNFTSGGKTHVSIAGSLISTPNKSDSLERVDSLGSIVTTSSAGPIPTAIVPAAKPAFVLSGKVKPLRTIVGGNKSRPSSYAGTPKRTEKSKSRRAESLDFKKLTAREVMGKETLRKEMAAVKRDIASQRSKENEQKTRKAQLAALNKQEPTISSRLSHGAANFDQMSGNSPAARAPQQVALKRPIPAYMRGTTSAGAKRLLQNANHMQAMKSLSPPQLPGPTIRQTTARKPKRAPTFPTPSKLNETPTKCAPRTIPMREKSGLNQSSTPAKHAIYGNAKTFPGLVPSLMVTKPSFDNKAATEPNFRGFHSENLENKAVVEQNLHGFRSGNPSTLTPNEVKAIGNPSTLTPKEAQAIGSQSRFPRASVSPRPLADITTIGSNKNPRPSIGRRLLNLKISPNPHAGKENISPSQAPNSDPSNSSSHKNKKHINLKRWFRHPENPAPNRNSSNRNSSGSALSGILRFGRTPAPEMRRNSEPAAPHQAYGFSQREIDNLKSRISQQYPEGGFNIVGGKYFTTKVPTLDHSPDREDKEENPIAVCMDLINTAHSERDVEKRESLFAMSRILVDAVTKSREAQCAAEEAKVAGLKAEQAVLLVDGRLRECTRLVNNWKAAGVVYGGF